MERSNWAIEHVSFRLISEEWAPALSTKHRSLNEQIFIKSLQPKHSARLELLKLFEELLQVYSFLFVKLWTFQFLRCHLKGWLYDKLFWLLIAPSHWQSGSRRTGVMWVRVVWSCETWNWFSASWHLSAVPLDVTSPMNHRSMPHILDNYTLNFIMLCAILKGSKLGL